MLQLPGRKLYLRAWRVDVGRVSLYLLDSNTASNRPEDRVVTRNLYGGNEETRLLQEIVLGRGGAQLLSRLSIQPSVFHMNEGHPAFLALERVGQLAHREGPHVRGSAASSCARRRSSRRTRPSPPATTASPRELIERYFGPGGLYSGLDVDRILRLGAEPAGDGEVFNMAVLGLRSAQRANGVSRLHGQVSRSMFRNLWPGFEVDEVPIGHITNGVHCPTWVNRDFSELDRARAGPGLRAARRVLGPARRRVRRGPLERPPPGPAPAGRRDPRAAARGLARGAVRAATSWAGSTARSIPRC